jgi:hypothetical protein
MKDEPVERVTTEWLDQRLPGLLAQAEEMYGPRDQRLRFLGCRMPGSIGVHRDESDRDAVWVDISPSTEFLFDQALQQLAHEGVHLLGPNPDRGPCMLEEGAAVHFSVVGPRYQRHDYANDLLHYFRTEPEARNYSEAYNLYKQAIVLAGDDLVCRLRVEYPTLDYVTPADIRRIAPELSELAEQLCERRNMYDLNDSPLPEERASEPSRP